MLGVNIVIAKQAPRSKLDHGIRSGCVQDTRDAPGGSTGRSDIAAKCERVGCSSWIRRGSPSRTWCGELYSLELCRVDVAFVAEAQESERRDVVWYKIQD